MHFLKGGLVLKTTLLFWNQQKFCHWPLGALAEPVAAGENPVLQDKISTLRWTNGVLCGDLKDVIQESSKPLALVVYLWCFQNSSQLRSAFVWTSLLTGYVSWQLSHFNICTEPCFQGLISKVPSKPVAKFPFTSVGTELLLEQPE